MINQSGKSNNSDPQEKKVPFLAPGAQISLGLVFLFLAYQVGYLVYLSYTNTRAAEGFQVSWGGILIVLLGTAFDTLYRQHKRIKYLENSIQQLQNNNGKNK